MTRTLRTACSTRSGWSGRPGALGAAVAAGRQDPAREAGPRGVGVCAAAAATLIDTLFGFEPRTKRTHERA